MSHGSRRTTLNESRLEIEQAFFFFFFFSNGIFHPGKYQIARQHIKLSNCARIFSRRLSRRSMRKQINSLISLNYLIYQFFLFFSFQRHLKKIARLTALWHDCIKWDLKPRGVRSIIECICKYVRQAVPFALIVPQRCDRKFRCSLKKKKIRADFVL